MKRTWLVLMIVLAMISSTNAMDLLVGGTYYDGHEGSLWTDGYGTDIQLRIPVASQIDIGLGTGYYRYNWGVTDASARYKWYRKYYNTNGSLRAIPLGISGIYKIPVKKCKIELEAGAKYLFVTDIDVDDNTATKYWSESEAKDIGNFWLGHLGANLVIPVGTPSIVCGLGYQWELGTTNLGGQVNNLEGAFARVGLMLPI